MTETQNEPIPVVAAQPRSAVPIILLVIFAPALFCGLSAYHFVMWSTEQTLSMMRPLLNITQIDAGMLAVQAVLVTFICGLLWYFTHDERLRPVYAGWLGASLVAFPAIGLRFLGPNNDQLGSLAQIAIALIGAGIAWRFNKMTWNGRALPAALMIAAIGIFPLVTAGALGSFPDFGLSLLSGLSLGLFATLLYRPTTGHILTDGLGILGVLTLLASALGYDGGQLILLASLPLFAFALAALMPSRAAGTALTGLVAAAALIFIDPTELSILLGDFTSIGLGAAFGVLGLAVLMGIVALIVRSIFKNAAEAGWRKPASMIGAGLLWLGVAALYFTSGHPGFYGDRLFVIFKDQADISAVAKIADRDERLSAAYEQLTAQADESQAGIRATLDKVGVKYTPYYLVNAMEVQGGTLVRLYLMTRPEVERVIPSPRLRPIPADEASPGFETEISGEPQWNIKMIGADKVWEKFGVRGEGIVIGQSDTGADASHPALRDQYRGQESGDDYNWFDPWDATTSPNDEGGHGTHTLGTILGKDGIGIAPEAQWIGCVNLDRNLGNPALYLDCMQFMLAPFPQGGNPFTDGDPTMAAHVLNNSWGCPEIEGCDPTALEPAVNNLRAAGIFVVVSAGNDGPECNTVKDPLAIYDSVFSVGALDENGDITSFSSRGPVTVDGSGRMKPDIAAPGAYILSSMPLNSYGTMSGTSMAGPHVVGAVALLWSADPSLIGDINRTEQILIRSARAYLNSRDDGCFEGNVPNAAFGYGVLDVYQAVKLALRK
jgi:subtilisin family serine protease